MQGQASRLLVETIRGAWDRLGFRAVEDEALVEGPGTAWPTVRPARPGLASLVAR